jgi:peptidoglycan/LPS O-acetylase OafA/YrhL
MYKELVEDRVPEGYVPDAAAPVPDAVAPPPGHLRLPMVDGVRAIAATTILGLHVGGSTRASGEAGWGDLIGGLGIGVPIFFVISGFLLYRPFVAADVLGAPAIRAGAFLWRRALRIIPLYWVALTVIFVLTHNSTDRPGGFFSGEPWWIFYGFGQVYDGDATGGGLTQAWTLCIEVTFYLALPLYAFALTRMRRSPSAVRIEVGVLAVIAVASLAFREAVTGTTAVYTLPSFFYLFVCGMLLALLSVEAERLPSTSRRLGGVARYAWGLAAVLFCIQNWVIRDLGASLATDVTDAVIATLVMTPAVFGESATRVRRFLGHPAVMWVGLVSYGLYLWHPQVVSAAYSAGIGDHFTGLGYFPFVAFIFVATATVAGCTYYAIERPVLKLKRLTRPGPRRQAAVRTEASAP